MIEMATKGAEQGWTMTLDQQAVDVQCPPLLEQLYIKDVARQSAGLLPLGLLQICMLHPGAALAALGPKVESADP